MSEGGAVEPADGLNQTKKQSTGREHRFIRPSRSENLQIPHVIGELSPPIMRRKLREYQSLYFEPRVKRSGLLVILFNTVARKPGFSFKILLSAIESLGADIFIIDDRQATLLMTGVEAWGPSRQRAVSVIGNVIADRKPERVCTLGHSSGGTAALIYGTLLPVQKVLVFNPIADVDTLLNAGAFPHKKKVWGRIVGGVSDAEEHVTNISTCITQSRHPEEIEFHFAQNSPQDVAQAAHVRAFEKVTLRGWEHDAHDLTRYLAQAGVLKDLLVKGLQGANQVLNEE